MRPAFTVLRIQKLKTWGAIAGSGKHNQRERETPNADDSRTAENRVLVGQSDAENAELVKEAVGTQRIRKNAVLGVEMLLSASPEYFRPGQTEKAGEHDAHRLNSWVDASTQWLKERYGNRVVKAVLHLDEATPHIHALLVPLDDKGKLNCRALFGGSRHTLSLLQNDYAGAVKDLGITRGIENSRATHQKVSQFYSIISKEQLAELPKPERYDAPDMLSKIERMRDKELADYARKAARGGVEAQRAVLEPVINAVKNENELLKRQNLDLKGVNSYLHKQNATLQEQMKVLRGVELGSVLTRLFKARGPYSKEDRDCYRLPGKGEVLVLGSHWHMRTEKNRKGKGAIDLVMALRDHEQRDLAKALGELGKAFGVGAVAGEYAGKAFERTRFDVENAVKRFVPPQDKELEQARQDDKEPVQERDMAYALALMRQRDEVQEQARQSDNTPKQVRQSGRGR